MHARAWQRCNPMGKKRIRILPSGDVRSMADHASDEGLNWQPSTKWSKKLGLVSSSMWVMVVANDSMVWRLVALVSMMVAPWREALPILVMRSGGMSGMKAMLVAF